MKLGRVVTVIGEVKRCDANLRRIHYECRNSDPVKNPAFVAALRSEFEWWTDRLAKSEAELIALAGV